jgi:hypothetical protein
MSKAQHTSAPPRTNVNLWEISFEVTHTASVVAFRVTGTRHVAPDLSKGRQKEHNDQSPRTFELNSERPFTGSSLLRRFHPPATPVCFQQFFNFLYSPSVQWGGVGVGGREGRAEHITLSVTDGRHRHVSVWLCEYKVTVAHDVRWESWDGSSKKYSMPIGVYCRWV